MSSIIGFTGTRQGMSDYQKQEVRRLLEEYKPEIVRHGMCVGADIDFHNICRELKIKTIIGHPGKFADGRPDIKGDADVDVLLEEDTHFSRNREIVNKSDIIIGCPLDNTKIGGTWYTINYSLKKIKKHILLIEMSNIYKI